MARFYGVVVAVLVAVSAVQGVHYNNEEKGCMEFYHTHASRPKVDLCETQKDLVECLLAHPGFDHFDRSDVARINEILDNLPRAKGCDLDVERIGKAMEENMPEELEGDLTLDQNDPTERTLAYLDCADTFLDIDASDIKSKCNAYRQYIHCILSIENVIGNAHDLDPDRIQDDVDAEFFKDAPCEINVKATLSKIMAKEVNNDVTTVAPPPASSTEDLSKDLMKCSEILINEFMIGSVEHTCPKVEEYVRCHFDALRAHHYMTKKEDIEELERELEARLSRYNLRCKLNIHSILADLQNNDPQPTTTPRSVADKLGGLGDSEQDGIRECFKTLSVKTPRNPSAQTELCGPFKEYLECIFEVVRDHGHKLSDEELEEQQKLINTGMPSCEINLKDLYTSVTSRSAYAVPCIRFHEDLSICHGKSDGDYAICPPKCQDGSYITCANYRRVPNQCPNGSYGNRLHPLVFDPKDKACQYSSPSCPRADYDDIIGGN